MHSDGRARRCGCPGEGYLSVSKIDATSGLVSALAEAWTIWAHGVSLRFSLTPMAAKFAWARRPIWRPISFPVGNQ